ncbi:hypothetical protein [Spirosoma spitsbergense]|uniref:hypothetical protein n=1 Tax=Spirosoma spitsbergense TaxID=431554 RepID=UPI000372DD0B|nr:hypothetical protein [Spirosoma spitsbergense]
MESKDREDIIRAKQAISPDGLADQSAEGHSGVGSELPDSDLPTEALPRDVVRDEYMDGPDNPGENVRVMHPNRHEDE